MELSSLAPNKGAKKNRKRVLPLVLRLYCRDAQTAHNQ